MSQSSAATTITTITSDDNDNITFLSSAVIMIPPSPTTTTKTTPMTSILSSPSQSRFMTSCCYVSSPRLPNRPERHSLLSLSEHDEIERRHDKNMIGKSSPDIVVDDINDNGMTSSRRISFESIPSDLPPKYPTRRYDDDDDVDEEHDDEMSFTTTNSSLLTGSDSDDQDDVDIDRNHVHTTIAMLTITTSNEQQQLLLPEEQTTSTLPQQLEHQEQYSNELRYEGQHEQQKLHQRLQQKQVRGKIHTKRSPPTLIISPSKGQRRLRRRHSLDDDPDVDFRYDQRERVDHQYQPRDRASSFSTTIPKLVSPVKAITPIAKRHPLRQRRKWDNDDNDWIGNWIGMEIIIPHDDDNSNNNNNDDDCSKS